jgi:DnaJ-class molecular chaperone
MAGDDYYSLIGVARTATADEIKKAYRNLVRKHHPDVDKTPGAEDRFKKINQAYEVLSDPQKRQTYDQFGSAAFEGNAASGPGAHSGGNPFGTGSPFGGFGNGGFHYSYSTDGAAAGFDPFDILDSFFGGQSPFGGARGRGPRLPTYQIQITFDEAVHGVEKEVSIENKSRKIKIPVGVDDGTRIKFDDFNLIVSVTPSNIFQRDGYDVIVEKEIPFTLASLGGSIKVPTIDGEVELRVQPGTQPETVVRLRERGIMHTRGNARGDEYVKYKVKVPTKLSGKARKLLEDLQKELV